MKAARIVIAAHALWLIASRPCLPEIFRWQELWVSVPAPLAQRYLWIFNPTVEGVLFLVLAASLILAIAGVMWRPACFMAAILLYHFAPLEDVFINTYGPYVRGLTVDILALVILAVAPEQRKWPLPLIRIAAASPYVFSTVGKLTGAGLGWFRGENMRDMAILFDRVSGGLPSRMVIDRPAVAWVVGIGWLLISLGMALAPFSRMARRIVVPLAAIAHILAVPLIGIVYLGAPLLLLFVDWPHRSGTENSSAQRASA